MHRSVWLSSDIELHSTTCLFSLNVYQPANWYMFSTYHVGKRLGISLPIGMYSVIFCSSKYEEMYLVVVNMFFVFHECFSSIFNVFL